jgi:murein DD-endopeptidase MepM/ murein hydrolase activator NlpD
LRRRKRTTKFYTFLLIPDNEKQTKSFKIKASFLRFIIVSIILIFILISIGFISYFKFMGVLIDYSDLKKDYERLNNALSKVEQLNTDMEKLKVTEKKLRTSLSGYVNVIKSDNDNVNSEIVNDLNNLDGERHERSIFNSIPDIMPVSGFITRGFETSSLLQDAHLAIDIAGIEGSPIKATADGLVIFSAWTFKEGNVIIIKHKFDYYSFYKHNLRNLCSELQYVKKGQIIALLGDSGQISSGAHLHFEIWQGATPINPMKVLRGSK